MVSLCAKAWSYHNTGNGRMVEAPVELRVVLAHYIFHVMRCGVYVGSNVPILSERCCPFIRYITAVPQFAFFVDVPASRYWKFVGGAAYLILSDIY